MPKTMLLIRRAGGLVGQPNPLTAPEGGLLRAENIVCDRDSVIAENRRGFSRYSTTALPGNISSMGEYKDRLLALQGSTLYFDANGAGGMTAYSGSFSPPDSNRMRFLEARKNVYFTTSQGVYKNDALASAPKRAGMPEGLDLQLTQIATSPVWFLNNKKVAYRIVWVRIDSNQTVSIGAPTARTISTNTSGASKSIQLTSSIPSLIVAGDYYEVHRTDLSPDQNTDPGDEMFKLARVAVTAADISARSISYIDTLDPIFLGDPLYTNPTEETIDQANYPPPFASDLVLYKGFVHYLNTRKEHRIKFQLLDATLIITGQTSISFTQAGVTRAYVASTVENAANLQFQKFTAGSGSQNIEDTMQSFCRVVNRDPNAGAFVECRYTSAPGDSVGDPVGMVEIRARTFLANTIYPALDTSTPAAAFSPTLPTIPGALASDNEARPNRLYFSKIDQPDAVPLVNFDDLGEEDSPGLRALALQDSLVVLMQEGIWRKTGNGETSFLIRPLDPSIKVFAKDAAVILDNSVYCLSDQGVVKISENGVAVMSWNTETQLKKIFSFPSFQTITHAAGYNSDRKYIVWTQEFSSDTIAKIGWVYNFFTQKWTLWRKPVSSSLVLKTSDLLYAAHAEDYYVIKERKSFLTSLDDYMDEDLPATITSVSTATYLGATVSTATLTYSYAARALLPGFLLFQVSSGQSGRVVSVVSNGGTSYTVTLEENMPLLAAGAATLSLPIDCIVQLKPESADNAGVAKHFSLVQLYMENDGAQNHEVGFFSDVKPLTSYFNYYSTKTSASAGWGQTPWGDAPWGDDEPVISPIIRTWVPTQYQRCAALTALYRHRTCREHFSMLNAAFGVRMLTDRTTMVPR